MRTTKALLCAAAIAAGAISTMAQSNVYSLNVVGYVNLTLTNGYNLIANQLDFDGNMTNNTLYSTLGTNLPNATKVYIYHPDTSSYTFATYFSSSRTWTGQTNDANAALTPGRGVFVQVPASASYPQSVTLVGQVIQGTNVEPIFVGFNNVSSVAPISGGIHTVLGYNPVNADKYYYWDVGGQQYKFKTYFSSSATWSPAPEPTPAVGESFFYNSKVLTNWTQAFTVQ